MFANSFAGSVTVTVDQCFQKALQDSLPGLVPSQISDVNQLKIKNTKSFYRLSFRELVLLRGPEDQDLNLLKMRSNSGERTMNVAALSLHFTNQIFLSMDGYLL